MKSAFLGIQKIKNKKNLNYVTKTTIWKLIKLNKKKIFEKYKNIKNSDNL